MCYSLIEIVMRHTGIDGRNKLVHVTVALRYI